VPITFKKKIGLALFWAIFFTNSSGHPAFYRALFCFKDESETSKMKETEDDKY
jgi:hypothetical protein